MLISLLDPPPFDCDINMAMASDILIYEESDMMTLCQSSMAMIPCDEICGTVQQY